MRNENDVYKQTQPIATNGDVYKYIIYSILSIHLLITSFYLKESSKKKKLIFVKKNLEGFKTKSD